MMFLQEYIKYLASFLPQADMLHPEKGAGGPEPALFAADVGM